MSRASDAHALRRAVTREQQLSARAIGSALALEAARAAKPDPTEMLPATDAQLAALRSTAVGAAHGVQAAWVSRDGRATRLKLGASEAST